MLLNHNQDRKSRLKQLGWLISLSACLAFIAQVVKLMPLVVTAASSNAAPLLRYPAVSRTQIAFVYANDIWLVSREGGLAIPLVRRPGQDSFPKFSPDGRSLAFTATFDGNRDLYTIPVAGGVPTRVTHHPAPESLCGWTLTGKLLLFFTNGFAGLTAQQQLFTVSAQGGLPEKLPVPYGINGAISPDGQWLAYAPHGSDFLHWKRYRGGEATNVWLFNLRDHSARKVTDWVGTDTLPMWHGDALYYLSDAGPAERLNIWSFDLKTDRRRQITHFDDFDVKWPSIGPGPNGQGEIIFQHGASLDLLDLATGKTQAVEVSIPGDLPTLSPQTVDVAKFIASASISARGERAVVEARGDIWSLPVGGGVPFNLTRTSGVAERVPAWSPDGRWIAYFSDATGEYELYLTQSDGKGPTQQLTRGRQLLSARPRWSPDTRHIAFTNATGRIFVHSLASGETKLVDHDPFSGAWSRVPELSWSHNSRWLAYAKGIERTPMSAIWLYQLETGEKHQVTSGMFNDSAPVFDRRGEYLYYKSGRSFHPTFGDEANTFIFAGTQSLIAVPLRANTPAPSALRNSEEARAKTGDKNKSAQPGRSQTQAQAPKPADDGISGVWSGTLKGPAPMPPEGVPFKLMLSLGRGNAVSGSLLIPTGAGKITSHSYDPTTKQLRLTIAADDGEVYTFTVQLSGASIFGKTTAARLNLTLDVAGTRANVPETAGEPQKQNQTVRRTELDIDLVGFERRALILPVPNGRFGPLAVTDAGALVYLRLPVFSAKSPSLKLFDLKGERKERQVASAVSHFEISADGKKLLLARGAALLVAAIGGEGRLVNTAGMFATITPREEWRQIFNEAWRLYRDFFYDPTMHGVDWPAMRVRYAKLVEDCASREDLNYVIGQMIAELNVSHANIKLPGAVEQTPKISVGMLGVDFELHEGAYRIAKIYEGAPWDADVRGPLSQPSLGVKEGDYLLAVNRVPLDTSKDPWAAFQRQAGRTPILTISSKPVLDGQAREISVKPLASEANLRNRAWIERNRAEVERKSGGKLGYIYLPDFSNEGLRELGRQFYGQMGKEALIFDLRWNGGGRQPDRFFEMLHRPLLHYWAVRYGGDVGVPIYSHQGPKCMLINGPAGSSGDLFPYYFRRAGLGKLIGTRTWGGVIGSASSPTFIDGGAVSIPHHAFYDAEGKWEIEGHGVEPDIEVSDDPALLAKGRDPQLEAAIEHLLQELKRAPQQPPARPDYRNRPGKNSKRP